MKDISQFVDDTTLYLGGKEESFRESVNVIVRFASMSGLKINFDKTSVVWIGSEKDLRIRFFTTFAVQVESCHIQSPWRSLLYKYRNRPFY